MCVKCVKKRYSVHVNRVSRETTAKGDCFRSIVCVGQFGMAALGGLCILNLVKSITGSLMQSVREECVHFIMGTLNGAKTKRVHISR